MRINKYIALCGVASRRKAEELILAGRVTVNDEVMTELSYKVDEENDIVKVDDKLIKEELKKLPSEKVRAIVEEKLAKIEEGERDFRF